jgi:ABC-2 type transport system ATP-binding protein
LEITGVSKHYKGFSLKNVSLTVPKGSIVGFIGPNGAGKTTTIKSALGMIKTDGGTVNICKNVSAVVDIPYYPDEWTCAVVEQAEKLFREKWNGEVYDRCLNRFEITKSKKVKELSRGMKVKLQIAAATSSGAQLIIADEPTSGLDVLSRDDLADTFRDFVSDGEKSVLFSTHITSDLEKCADYIVFLLHGRVFFNGTKDELLEKYVRVTGGKDELSFEEKKKVIGIRESGFNYEGIAEVTDAAKLPNAVVEPATLEEIIIFADRGDKPV